MDAEYSLPPPEALPVGREFRVGQNFEFAPLPPEYGQRTTAQDGEPEKKRRLRKILAVPALLLLSFLCFHIVRPAAPTASDVSPEPPGGSAASDAAPGAAVQTPPPTLSAQLEISDSVVKLTADFKPAADDRTVYDMAVESCRTDWLDADGQIVTVSDLAAEEASGQGEAGMRFVCTGSTDEINTFDGIESAVGRISLRDAATGRIFTAETEPVAYSHEAAYPIGNGNIVLTVYNDTTIYDVASPVSTDGWITVLASETIPEADFAGYQLPEPTAPDGYGFAGWVVHVGNPFDNGSDRDVFAEFNGDPPVDILLDGSVFTVETTLTKKDVERIPPSADGNRYVNVHACWIQQNPSDIRLYLDDGSGNAEGYSMDVPLASEGYLYLCSYPVPEREGYAFDGWYDKDGNRVDMLVCYFSFVPALRDENGNFTGYDWGKNDTVTLYAHWKAL